jgi:hypothetical protein
MIGKTTHNLNQRMAKPLLVINSLLEYDAMFFKTSYPKILIFRNYLYENSLAQNEMT